jgi:phosphate-selective porin OprO/OprP
MHDRQQLVHLRTQNAGRRSLVAALALGLCTAAASATETEFDPRRGLLIEWPEAGNSLRVGGRLQYDISSFDADVTGLEDENDFRRARLYLSGRLGDNWRFKVERDEAKITRDWTNVWFEYRGIEDWRLRAGQTVAPFSLEEMTSSNHITFMERALPNAFVPSFQIGALARTSGDGWGASFGYFDRRFDDDRIDDSIGPGLSGRLTFYPLRERGRLIHLGLSANYREPDGNTVRYRARPEARFARALVDTGTIDNVEETLAVGVEAATVLGPLSLQGEYIVNQVGRSADADLDFSGWYAYASWFVTGESRRYSRGSGVFGQVRPESEWGAWELGLRYSAIDLDDADVTGGKLSDITLGLNWYPKSRFNTRVMLNYVMADAEPNRNGVDESPEAILLRAQVHF